MYFHIRYIYLILAKEQIYISQDGAILDPVLCTRRIMKLTFVYWLFMWEWLAEWFSCHFHTLFGILAQRIIKLTKNEAGLDRLEIKDRAKLMCKQPIWNYVWTFFLIPHTRIRTVLHEIWKQALEVFYKKVVLKHFAKFTGKPLCRSLFVDKGWQFY